MTRASARSLARSSKSSIGEGLSVRSLTLDSPRVSCATAAECREHLIEMAECFISNSDTLFTGTFSPKIETEEARAVAGIFVCSPSCRRSGGRLGKWADGRTLARLVGRCLVCSCRLAHVRARIEERACSREQTFPSEQMSRNPLSLLSLSLLLLIIFLQRERAWRNDRRKGGDGKTNKPGTAVRCQLFLTSESRYKVLI